MTHTPISMRHLGAWDDVPVDQIFDTPNLLAPSYVQELMIALENAKTVDGKPATPRMSVGLSPYNLLFAAVLHLLEKQQPGIMGYKPDA